jgi:mannitol/fructose-specific phosphotransferase system IIA component (Ntr-type)
MSKSGFSINLEWIKMKSILDALQEGRLIELPDNHKEHVLKYLASLIEAIPDIQAGTDVEGAVVIRERAESTGIGMGWACPHGRHPGEGELVCAVGWSPTGIEYGSPDGKPVHLVVMHYVPDAQKNVYLKEISGLLKVIKKNEGKKEVAKASNLMEVRNLLLDLIADALETEVPEAKARMIRLEAKQAAVIGAPEVVISADLLSSLNFIPLSILVIPGSTPIILSQDQELVSLFESPGEWASSLAEKMPFTYKGFRILPRSVTTYQPNRFVYDCLAIRIANSNQRQSGKEAT